MQIFREEMILDALRKLKERVDEGNPPSTGICNYVHRETPHRIAPTAILHSLKPHFIAWPHFSGIIGCPVTAAEVPTKSNAKLEYEIASWNNGLWDQETEYGRLRYVLLCFIIEKMEGVDDVRRTGEETPASGTTGD